jgi:hypothetical protein
MSAAPPNNGGVYVNNETVVATNAADKRRRGCATRPLRRPQRGSIYKAVSAAEMPRRSDVARLLGKILRFGDGGIDLR